MTLARLQHWILTLFMAFALPCLSFAESSQDKVNDLRNVSSEEFLSVVRTSTIDSAWMELSGKLACRRNGAEMLESDIILRASFAPNVLVGQISMDNGNAYVIDQRIGENGEPKVELDCPSVEKAPSIFDFGVSPGDLSFAFIYWNFVEEMPRQSSRLQECRVMKLANPDGTGHVVVFFHSRLGFPMEAKWYRTGEDEPWRELLMKGAKRHENGFWFVKEMLLEGKDWKTSVRFDYVNKNQIGE